MRRFPALAALLLAAAPTARAQAYADTLFAWQGYGRASQCRLAVYPVADDADRQDRHDRVVVVRELADNGGASTLDDAGYLVEQASRSLGIAAERIVWVFHWGGFSYASGADRGKEVFLRATFRRGAGGQLSAPSWRVVTRADVEELTDRRFGGRTAVAARR